MGIENALMLHDTSEHPKGESLPEDQCIYHVKVVHAFLLAGISLNKVPALRDILEEHAYHLTDRWQMSDIVPFILAHEKEKLKSDVPYSKKLWREKNFGEFGELQQFANFFVNFPVFVT